MKCSSARTRAVAIACLLAPCGAAAQTDLELGEVFYDAVGGDDQLEWVELVNAGDVPVDLAGWSLGWGGSDWTSGRQALEGVVDAGARFVVGGPLSTAADASPVFDLAVDLEPDLQNSGATADGVALFAVPAEEIAADTLPVDVVVYGEANTSGLIDATGAVAAVDVADAPGGSSIERGADGVWRAQPAPTPGAPPAPVPEPSHLVLALGATFGVACRGGRATGGGGVRDADFR
jgi:hypothetical protein